MLVSTASPNTARWSLPRLGLLLGALVSLGVVTACDPEGEACGLDAKEIGLDVRVIDGKMGVIVIAELTEQNGTDLGVPLELCSEPEEKIEINGKLAKKETFEGVARYVRRLEQPAQEYEVKFVREDDTYTTVVPGAAPFKIMEPSPDAMLSRTMPITVRWDPGDPNREVALKIEREDLLCLDSFETEVPDTGMYEILASYHNLTSSDAGPECDASIVITRRNEAPPPQGLHKNSHVEALVRRAVRFVSVP